ncbi:MAG: hypothetical protein MUE40_02335 [Anaerolineae bacterium]|jgi:hypothetical protein|nr:hypothetical protein [Anaerolineae bacterium]
MNSSSALAALLGLQTPEEIFYELNREGDACDVIVRLDDGSVYTATFVTMDYLRRQMDLSFQVMCQMPDTPPVRYAVIDTTHVVVEALERDLIEDTIDNLINLDVFESYFIRVTEDPAGAARTMNDGRRATQEVAAVVISDVLVVQQ